MKRVRFTGDSSEVRDAKFSAKCLKRRPTALKLAKLGSEDVVFRYQALKVDCDNIGFHSLYWGDPLGTTIKVPMHIYNLSLIPNGGAGLFSGAAGIDNAWSNSLGTADCVKTPLSGLDANGLAAANLNWIAETNGLIDYDKVTKAMHKWTSIKMQCYGSSLDDTKFTVTLAKFKDDFANLWNAAGSNGQSKELQDYLTHTYMGSRINPTAEKAGKNYIKILKEWSIVVPRRNGSEIGSNQRELNMFVRHNWVNDYNWPVPSTNYMNTHDYIGNMGYGTDFEKHQQPLPTKSLFLIVRATCPFQVTTEANLGAYNGTYNIMMRNCYTVPT